MNLLGIVWSNLEEFIRVRIPLDDHKEDLIPKFFETLELFDSAIQRKFPNLYMSNDLDKADDAREIIYGCAPDASPAERHEAAKAVRDELCNADNPIGLFRNGMFYHVNFVDRLLSEDGEGLCVGWYLIEGDSAKIGPPENTEDELESFMQISNWTRSRMSAFPDVKFSFVPTEFDDCPQFEYEKGDPDIMPSGILRYTISYRNPLFLCFDQVAKKILTSGEQIIDDGMDYEADPSDLESLRSCIVDCKRGVNTKFEMIRTGFRDENLFIKHLYAKLFGIDYESNKLTETHEVVKLAQKIHRGKKSSVLNEAWMTIYRTGEDFTDANYAFIMLIAALLGPDAHFLIECRARGDEKNNLLLMDALKYFDADVHLMANGYGGYKVHAKIWTFAMTKNHTGKDAERKDRVYLTAYSTGNYVESAQHGFSDTILIEEFTARYPADQPDSMKFWNEVGFPKKTVIDPNPDPDKPTLDWKPGTIRKRLLEQIKASTAMANLITLSGESRDRDYPFIFIKVNHLTDKKIIKALKEAAKAGVLVNIIVRTTCTINTQAIPNIHVRSVMGKYLEHDRMFLFGTGKVDECVRVRHAYISTADLMPRNLDNRIEFMKRVDGTAAGFLLHVFLTMFETSSIPEAGFFNFPV
jgi:hypothetical protein